jgi:hypothetical protein
MPGLARLDAPGILHPIMGRGIEKRKIIWGAQGRLEDLEIRYKIR